MSVAIDLLFLSSCGYDGRRADWSTGLSEDEVCLLHFFLDDVVAYFGELIMVVSFC